MVRTLSLLLASALLVVGAPAPMLWAVDYLVIDNDGATGGDGTLGNEFGTITEALNNAPLAAGDRIVLAAGSYDDTDETLPLNIPDGVSIIGAGAGTTTISGVTDPANVLLFSGGGNAQLLSGVTVLPHSSWVGVLLTGSSANFQAQSCVFSGGSFHIVRSSGVSNCVATVSNCSFIAPNDHAIVDTSALGTGAWVIQSNLFMSGGSQGIRMGALGSGTQDLALNALSNTFSGGWNAGMFIGGFMTGAGSAVFNATLIGNQASSCGAGFNITFGAGNSAMFSGNIVVSCNQATSCGAGFVFENYGISSGVVIASWLAVGNSANSNSVGFVGSRSALSSASLTYDSGLSNNCARGNAIGIRLAIAAGTNAVVDLEHTLHANLVASNTSAGIVFVTNITASSVTGTVHLGGDVFTKGLNAIFGNGTGLVASVAGSTDTWNAMGNWWGASTSTGVESTIVHQVDSAALTLIDFSGFLQSSMTLTPVGLATVGSLLTVTTPDGGFVPFAGKNLMQTTFNGNPIAVNVAADGCTLSFVVPLLVPGAYALIVTNPGGQSGTVNITVFAASGGGGGGCFVATAAYGDEESIEVRTLRQWRDEHLAKNAIGRQLVKAYYAVSPPLAEAIAERPWARTVSRAALAPVIGSARLWMEAPWALFGLAGGAAWLLLRRKR